jgi:3-hydroxybutyryl-CoA dehydrogenase
MSKATSTDARIAVVGAGVIGSGVAQALAQTDFQVRLIDSDPEALSRARLTIERGLRLQRLIRPGTAAALPALQRITFSDDLAVDDADIVIENITESWAAKEPLYRLLDARCPPQCVLAANTSAIPVTQIAGITRRPESVVGIHFMNPVPLKDTVEVVRGYHTSPATLQKALDLLVAMGKSGVIVNDAPGFVSNRVLMVMINEAIYVVSEQVASVEDVDRIFRECMGHQMGPLETADLIGLDTVLQSLEVLCEQFKDPKFRPCPLLRKLVAAGLRGRKSGRGLYTHD